VLGDHINVCFKEFKTPNVHSNYVIVDAYEKMKKMIGHPNLISPIAVYIDQQKVDQPKDQPKDQPIDQPKSIQIEKAIITELARNKIRSLDDVVHSFDLSESKKIQLGFERKLFIAQCTARALAWIHENAEVSNVGQPNFSAAHLRLKPSNILFTTDWNVKLSDYGLGLPHEHIEPSSLQKVLFDRKYAHYSAPEIFQDPPRPCAQSDSWSYGMILYTLLTDKFPFEKEKDYESIKEAIKSRNLPEIPKNTPETLKTLIDKCWSDNPADRDRPIIIADKDPWKKIFQEASLGGQKEVERIWNAALKTHTPPSDSPVPWEKFAPIFWENMGMTLEDHDKDKNRISNCIRELLTKKDGKVTLKGFTDFAKTFSPMRTGPTGGPAYLKNILSLCATEWFYGAIGRGDAEGLVNTADKKKFKNPCVLRLSENSENKFCFTRIINGKMENIVVEWAVYQTEGFLSYLKGYIKNNKLDMVKSKGNKFSTFFEKEPGKPLKIKTSGTTKHPDSSFLAWSSYSLSSDVKFINH
jgi:hypothetical protein